MYTIGQVSEMFGLPVSTLRYYDKEGLFPQMERASGMRRFGEREIEALRVIECLKRSGLEIRDIKRFMDWCMEGSSTYPQRLELFETQRAAVEAEERLGLRRTREDGKFAAGLYSRFLRAQAELLRLNARPGRRPLYGNSLALAQTVQLMVFDEPERAVDALDREEGDAAALALAQKLLRRYAGEPDAKKAMAKLMAAMARRGYDFESARRAVEQALEEAQGE